MPRHTTMPPRIQKTPHGDVSLTSKWAHNRYYLVAYGSNAAVRWLFNDRDCSEIQAVGENFRRVFQPAKSPITVERKLRRVCCTWQEIWDNRYADHQLGIHPPSSVQQQAVIQTVGQLFDQLFAIRQTQIAASTTERDRYYIKLWRSELGGETKLATIAEDMLVTARARIAKRTSPSTANCAMGTLKAYLNWAFHKGHLPNASFRTIKRLKEPANGKSKRAWWTAAEVALALKCAAADQHQPCATLLVACGCLLGLRLEEIVMVRWQDLDLDAVDPKTGEPKPVCHLTPHADWQPKDGEARDIPISGELHAILLRHRRKIGYLLNKEIQHHRVRKAVAPWAYRYDPRKIWDRICALVKAAGGRPITMYGMRHTFASNLLIAGVSDVKIARWLGHTDTRMVHKHYGHLMSYDSDINAVRYRPPAMTGPPEPQKSET